jgi:CubicO group peptidase (beta-lactamase class C family)
MKQLTAQIIKTAEENRFPGVVSISRNQRILYESAFGYRDMANEIPNDVTTRFGTASGTKLFTALGIGKLIDRGELKLETKVSELPIETDGFISSEATIENLLSHTSGIFDYYDEEIIEDFDNFSVSTPWCKLETPADYLPLYRDQKAKFTPDQRFSYSNGGYVYLGMIIEAVTKTRYRDFIRSQVLAPAGMAASGFFALNELPPNTATGYFENRRTSNLFQIPIRGGGDGGMFTTAQDIDRFWSTLFAGNIISQDLLRQLTVIRHRFSDKLGYARGIYLYLDRPGYAIIGSDAGVGFYSAYFPPQAVVVTVISNITDGEAAIKRLIIDNLESILQNGVVD